MLVSNRSEQNFSSHLRVLPEIAHALATGQPVVALESSIIAHGLPFPTNIETAFACEKIIREQGAMPATIAVIDRKICIGLTEHEIAMLGSKKTSNVIAKISTKDLGYAVATGLTGATTVSATMIAAHHASIRFFATGGIGGVHRGAETTMDISADLEELARTPVAVISSGAKSILDIGLTLEVLETKGVPIIGFGTQELPAFFTRSSGYKTDCQANSAEEIASIVACHWQLLGTRGVLIANPVPEDAAVDEDLIDQLTSDAVATAARLGVRHKAVTPFLLSHIAENSRGLTLHANISLVKNNAALAAIIAKAFKAQIQHQCL